MSLDFDSARLRDPNLRPEHEEWRAQLRRFIDREIMPHVDEWVEACRIPDALWPRAAEIGLLGLGYPLAVLVRAEVEPAAQGRTAAPHPEVIPRRVQEPWVGEDRQQARWWLLIVPEQVTADVDGIARPHRVRQE